MLVGKIQIFVMQTFAENQTYAKLMLLKNKEYVTNQNYIRRELE
jgi:hypothetical protein